MKYIILSIVLLLAYNVNSQNKVLFEYMSQKDKSISTEDLRFLNYHYKQSNVKQVDFIKINFETIKNEIITIRLKDKSYKVNKIDLDKRSKNSFTWFGVFTDYLANGIFLTVNGNSVASKFSIEGRVFSLYPLKTGNHILVEYSDTSFICGNEFDKVQKPNNKKLNFKHKNDDSCTLRVLMAYTTQAEIDIHNLGLTLNTFSQMAIDETNLAYDMSQINIDIELAISMRVNYAEVCCNDLMGTDLNRLKNGTNGLGVIHDMRNYYETDIQILIETDHPNLGGRAFHVLTDNNPANPANGFCIVDVPGVTSGRFSFAHEIGHLQGARHENHNDNPNFARGFLSNNTSTAWRTLMTRQSASGVCPNANACRIGVFSNPNINGPGNVPAGNGTRNNSRMINQTAPQILNYRIVSENLILTNEEVKPEIESNHLANHRIDSNNSIITYFPESTGTIRAGEMITFKHGVTISNGSRFVAYIDNNPCEEIPIQKVTAQTNSMEASNLIDKQDNNLIIYPNPVKDVLKLQLQNNIVFKTIEIYNSNFTNIYSNEISKKKLSVYEIDISNFKSGIYLVKIITSEGKTYTKKILKK
ncbi:MAG: zinc-dependent metalloprotease [Polaribacter sp.]